MTWNIGSWNPTTIGMWAAAFNGVTIFVMANVRRRTVSLDQIGFAVEGTFASLNLWPPVYLFLFIADAQKRATLPPLLANYEIYIAAAAIFSLLVTVTGLVSAYIKAWKA